VIEESLHPLIRYLRLEASWILTNLSYAHEQDLILLFEPKFGFIEHINKILDSKDIIMIDQIIWLISNTAGESSHLRSMMLK
jgi:hypothetical protein